MTTHGADRMNTPTDDAIPGIFLFDGQLYRFGRRLGLVRSGRDSTLFGLAMGIAVWSILMLLTVLSGSVGSLFSIAAIGAHVRLLVAIPLFFFAETMVAPRMELFVRDAFSTGLVPVDEIPVLSTLLKRIGRLGHSRLAEPILLVIACFMPTIAGSWHSPDISERSGLSGWWYASACLPLFRFILIRWLWHLLLWYLFLWRVRNMSLRMIPVHPDMTGGLGYLNVVHEGFFPLVLGLSATLSASFAEDISTGRMPFEALSAYLPFMLIMVLALFTGPLLLFAARLRECRVQGMSDYHRLASAYVSGFEGKWITSKNHGSADRLLGSSDIQSLADLHNSFLIIDRLRRVPAGKKLIVGLAVCALLPMSPLLLFKYPLSQILFRILKILSGF